MRCWILVGVCLGLGCSKSEARREAEVSSAEETAIVDQTAAQREEPSFELTSQGEAPFRKLRWQFTEGTEQDIEVELTFLKDISVGSQKVPAKRSPPIHIGIAVTVKEVAPNGGAKAELRVAKAAVEAASKTPTTTTTALQRSVASIIGALGSYTVEPNGLVKEIAFEIPPAADLQGHMIINNAIKPAAMHLVGPLPEQPLGVGAKWSVTQAIKQPHQLDRTSTYELVKLEGDYADVEILVEQTAPPQTLGNAPATDGQAARLEAYQSKDRGKARWDLSSLAPRSAELTTSWTAEVSQPAMQQGGGVASFESDVRIRRK